MHSFHRDSSGQTYAYLACELNTTLLSYTVDPSSGSLHPLGAEPLSCLPPGLDAGGTPATGHARTTSEIAVSPDGRHVYVGTRGDPDEDHIAVFERAASTTGEVRWLGWDAIGGRNLRHFSMTGDGRWVIAAGQDSGSVVVLQRDEGTGRLSKVEGASVGFEKVAFAGVVVDAAASS